VRCAAALISLTALTNMKEVDTTAAVLNMHLGNCHFVSSEGLDSKCQADRRMG